MRPVAGRFSLTSTLHVAACPSSHTLHAAVCTCVAGRSLASSRCVSQPFKRTRAFYVKKRKRCENAIKTYTKRKRPHRCTETERKRNVNFILAATVGDRELHWTNSRSLPHILRLQAFFVLGCVNVLQPLCMHVGIFNICCSIWIVAV